MFRFIALLVPAVHGLWSLSSTRQHENPTQLFPPDARSLRLSTSEHAAMFLSTPVMQPQELQSDCFRDAASHLQCESLEIEELARIRAAIAFTLCELATARGHSPPLECSSFAKTGSGAELPIQKHYACVEALQRSVQFWTTYSGYLQRISLHCIAFRAGAEIDVAKNFYVNATKEKVALLRHLHLREELLRMHLDQLQTTLANLDMLSNHLETNGYGIVDQMHDMRDRAKDAFMHFSAALHKHISEQHAIHAEAQAALNMQATTALSTIALNHEQRLSAVLDGTRGEIIQHLQTISSSSEQQIVAALTALDDIRSASAEIGIHVNGVAATLHALAPLSLRLSSSLEDQIHLAERSNAQLGSLAQRIETLGDSVTGLTLLVRDEMHTVNETSSALQKTLSSATPASDWPTLLASRILGMLLDYALASKYGAQARYLLDFATIKGILLFCRYLWHMTCSWPMGMVLLCVSLFRSSTRLDMSNHSKLPSRSRIHSAEHSLLERRDGRGRDERYRGRIHSVATSF